MPASAPSAPPAEDTSTTGTRPIYARETLISEMFGIPVATLRTRRVRHPDSPPFVKLGRSVLYKVEDVEAWIQEEAEKGGSETEAA